MTASPRGKRLGRTAVQQLDKPEFEESFDPTYDAGYTMQFDQASAGTARLDKPELDTQHSIKKDVCPKKPAAESLLRQAVFL